MFAFLIISKFKSVQTPPVKHMVAAYMYELKTSKTLALHCLPQLCRELLLAKLWHQISAIMTKFSIESVNFWSDPQVTLYWLKHDSGTLVARGAKNQELSNGVVWRHRRNCELFVV